MKPNRISARSRGASLGLVHKYWNLEIPPGGWDRGAKILREKVRRQEMIF